MLVHLSDLEPFYTTNEFLVDLQSGELFVKLQDRWHPAGLTCKKRNFEVDSLMALIQHVSIRLKNKIYRRKEEQTSVLTLDISQVQAPPLPFIPRAENYVKHDRPMSPVMRKNYIKDRAQAAVTYITEYGNTKLWSLERKAPLHKLTQRLQIVFGRVDAVRKAVDEVIEHDDEIRRKKCMHCLRPPKRFPIPEDMQGEETATWINWIHMETHAMLEDLNEEIKLQDAADDQFTQHIVYAPINLVQEPIEHQDIQEPLGRDRINSKISPAEGEQYLEEKLASLLLTEVAGKLLPQRVNNQRGEIPPVMREIRSKPPTHTARKNTTQRQINYDSINWDANNTSYMLLPLEKQQTVPDAMYMNDTTDIRLCYRCGGEGHIRKYCNINVHCEFCKSYTHHTSICRSYANFVRAHPMASSRRTSPTQPSRQEGGTQESNEGIVEGNLRMQKEENQRDGEKRRELSEITQKHLERVINTMILSSGGSSLHSVENAPMNSMISQLTEKSIEGTECKQNREKQVIVYNYYINDGREGWKQVEKSEIPPNVLNDKIGVELAENLPSRLGNVTHGYSGEISPRKPGHNVFSAPSGKEEETRYPDKKRINTTEAKTEPRRFYEQEMEAQNMSPPPTYNPNYPPPNRYSGYQETTAMLDCIRQLQLTMQQHVLTNSKQAEYHMSQNADLFMEMAKGQRRRDLDPAVMAIPTFMGQEPGKCLDWINRIRNVCNQAGQPPTTRTHEQI